MSIQIDQKIVGYAVVKPNEVRPTAKLLERDEVLSGKTYKIKTPLSDHAFYITINDLNGRPFELFIASKDMTNFQWVTALTRIISAVFRTGGNLAFLVEELKVIVDPKGGYFKRGRFIPSLVAEIGLVLETHMKGLGLITPDETLAGLAQKMVAEKAPSGANKSVCAKCGDTAVVVMDGCATCCSCGDSKCG